MHFIFFFNQTMSEKIGSPSNEKKNIRSPSNEEKNIGSPSDEEKNIGSPSDEKNLYYYTNKGKQQTFNLDDLTTAELKKFEKMTERQRLRFIASFELERNAPFQDSVSLKPMMTEARNEKYGDYALLKAKFDEVEKILDQDKDYENNEKLSLLDEDGKIIPEYLEQMNYITEEDLKNCMKAFDLKDVSLGMLKKYYNRKIESIELPGIKTSFLEALKKFYKELYKKDDKDDVMGRKIDSSFVTFNSTPATPTNLTTAMENAMVDANKQMKTALSAILKPMNFKGKDSILRAIDDFDWDKVKYIATEMKFPEMTSIITNYQGLTEMLNKMYNPPRRDVTTPLALTDSPKSKPTIKVEEVLEDEEIPEVKEEPPKEEPPKEEASEEERIDINSPAKRYEARKQQQFEKEFSDLMKIITNVKNTDLTELQKGDSKWNLTIDESKNKRLTREVPEQRMREQIVQNNNNDIGYAYEIYERVKTLKNGRHSFEGSFKRPYLLVYRPVTDQYEITVYENGNPNKIARKYTYRPNSDNKVNLAFGQNGADLTFTQYGKGYKIKYTSGSLIDKIKNKFLKSVNDSISDLKEEDKNIYSKLDSLESQIKDLKRKLLDVESIPKQKDIPSPPPPTPPKSESFSFFEDIKKPIHLKPVKPFKKPVEEKEYSDIEKILNDRRKDIEYSTDSEEEEEWGEGVRRLSKKEEGIKNPKRKRSETTFNNGRRMEILEFLNSLD